MRVELSLKPSRIRELTRRTFLGSGFAGLGSIALNSIFSREIFAKQQNDRWRGVVNPLHYQAKAR